jgi:tetratricopeptide (TPR) repeat protein
MSNMKNKIRIVSPLIIFLAIMFSGSSFGQTARYDRKIDKSTLFYLFKNKGFKHLNTKLEELQKAYDVDYYEESNLYNAYDVFSKADPTFVPILSEWIKQFPDSYAPYIARAKYYCACAWKLFGRKRTIDRDGKEYAEMEKIFSLALLDITEALKKNVQSDVCYTMRMEIGAATGNEELINNSLAEALKYHPYAYRIRLQYLQSLTPQWGGTYQKMETYINECEKYIPSNPALKELQASIPADKGRAYAYLGKYDHAIKMYSEALKFSSFPAYYIDRGDAYVQLRDYKSALADYEQALKLSPNDPDYLDRKASVRSVAARSSAPQKTNSGAFSPGSDEDINQDRSLVAVRQEAIEHAKKGNDLMDYGKFQEAIAEFSETIRLSPGDYVPYYNRGLCYQQIKNDDAALQDFLSVVERKPDNVGVYMRIMNIYANRGMYDDAINAVNNVISADPKNGAAYYYRSKIYEKKGNNVGALEDMRQACDLGYQPACRYYNQVK